MARFAYPLLTTCSYNSGTYTYTVNAPTEAFAAGKYVVWLEFDMRNAAIGKFHMCATGNVPARTEFLFTLQVAGQTTVTDDLNVNSLRAFSSILLQDASLTTGEYDLLLVNF